VTPGASLWPFMPRIINTIDSGHTANISSGAADPRLRGADCQQKM